jgi:hypothetical protein
MSGAGIVPGVGAFLGGGRKSFKNLDFQVGLQLF